MKKVQKHYLNIIVIYATKAIMSKKITAFRKQTKLSMAAFGALIGVDKGTVSRWESGKLPAERIHEIYVLTDIPYYDLRPDLFPKPKQREVT